MERPRVSLVTCAEVPDLDSDDAALVPALAERGVEAVPAVWDDPALDWEAAGLVVLRSTWDYPLRRDAFVAWARTVPRLLNPPPVVKWNSDKRYLDDLRADGVPVVDTVVVAPGEAVRLPREGEFVVKPTVSGGSKDTGRYDAADAGQVRLAVAHADRLLAAGRHVMVQPYLDGVDVTGESAMVHVDGAFSHAVTKGQMLHGPDPGVAGLYVDETITPRQASGAERAVGEQVVAAVARRFPADWPLLYARVDVLPGPDGPVLLELELVEPSLHMSHAPGALDRFADALAARALTT